MACVECKELPAIYWNKSFCMKCFKNFMNDGTEDNHEPREIVPDATSVG